MADKKDTLTPAQKAARRRTANPTNNTATQTPTEGYKGAPPTRPTAPNIGFRGIDSVQQRYGGPNASPDQKQAWDLVEAEYGAPRLKLNQNLSQAQRDQEYQTGQQENFGETYDKKLTDISGLLQEQLGGITDRTQSMYGNATQGVRDAYGQASQSVQGASGSVQDQLQATMERLGLNEAGGDPLSKLVKQQADASGRHEISGVGAAGNMAGLGADMTAISAKQEGDSAQEYAMHRRNLVSEVMSNINTINKEYNDTRNALMSDMQGLETERGSALSSTLQQVINERLDRERQDKLDKLAEEFQRGSLDIQEGYLDLSRDRFGLETELGRGNLDVSRGGLDVSRGHLGVAQGQLEIQREQLGMQRDQLKAEIESANSEWAKYEAQLELQEIEAKIRNLDSQTNKNNNPAGGGGSDGRQYKGLQGVQQFAQDNGLEPNGAIMGAFNNLVTQAWDLSARSGVGFNEALMSMVSKEGDPRAKQKLGELAHIYIGNYASYAE